MKPIKFPKIYYRMDILFVLLNKRLHFVSLLFYFHLCLTTFWVKNRKELKKNRWTDEQIPCDMTIGIHQLDVVAAHFKNAHQMGRPLVLATWDGCHKQDFLPHPDRTACCQTSQMYKTGGIELHPPLPWCTSGLSCTIWNCMLCFVSLVSLSLYSLMCVHRCAQCIIILK